MDVIVTAMVHVSDVVVGKNGYYWQTTGHFKDACKQEPCTNGYANEIYTSHGDLDPKGCNVERNCSHMCAVGEYLFSCNATDPGVCRSCTHTRAGYYWTQ